jgi:hypothetical protein
MWIVAIGWMYVVTLMAATEPTVVRHYDFFRLRRVAIITRFLPRRLGEAGARERRRGKREGAGA